MSLKGFGKALVKVGAWIVANREEVIAIVQTVKTKKGKK